MSYTSITPVVADCFTGSKIALNAEGYNVTAMSISQDDNLWKVTAEAHDVEAGIPDRCNVEAHDLAHVMGELEAELQLILSLQLHLSHTHTAEG